MGKARSRTGDPEAAQAERRELIEKLEKGFQQVQESDQYRRYLADSLPVPPVQHLQHDTDLDAVP